MLDQYRPLVVMAPHCYRAYNRLVKKSLRVLSPNWTV